MTIQRLAELATAIAAGEDPDLKCVVKTVRQISDSEVVTCYAPIKDLCLSEEGVLLIRT